MIVNKIFDKQWKLIVNKIFDKQRKWLKTKCFWTDNIKPSVEKTEVYI